jgi:hypothetical protein
MRSKYLIDNIPFKTDKDAQNYARCILYTNSPNTVLNEQELKFMASYFQAIHHDWTNKVGVGILNIRRVMDSVYGKHRAFQIERVDGSLTDISYIIANIKAPKVDQTFKQALRWVIEPQIIEYKRAVFSRCPVINCPVSGEALMMGYCHADHYDPTFEEIVKDFVSTYEIYDYSKVVATSRDNQTKAELKDESIAKLFYEYHKSKAVIRLVSPSVNLTRKRKQLQ